MRKNLDKLISRPEIKLNILKQTMWEKNDESIVNDEGGCEL